MPTRSHQIRVVIACEGFSGGKTCFGANRAGDDRIGDGEVRQGNGPIVENVVGVVDLIQDDCDFVVSGFTVQNPACF